MFCIHCGKENEDGSSFCRHCGKPIGEQEAPAAAPVSAVPANKANKRMLIIFGIGLAAILIIVLSVVLGIEVVKKVSGGDKNNDVSSGGSSDGGGLFGIGELFSDGGNPDAYFDEPFKIGDVIKFGSYEQDGNTSNGKEPIEWKVVGSNSGGYLLVSSLILDCMPYDDGSTSDTGGALSHDVLINYEKCTLRQWLQDGFANEAFNDKEKSMIMPVSVKDDVITVKKGNEYASDLVFIPSEQEMNDYFRGSASYHETNDGYYYYSCSSWRCPASSYALDRGVESVKAGFNEFEIPGSGYAGAYYLRNRVTHLKKLDNQVLHVLADGTMYWVNMYEKHGVRPAIYLTVTADDFKSTGDDSEKIPDAQTVEYLKYYTGGWNYSLTSGGFTFIRAAGDGNSYTHVETYTHLESVVISDNMIEVYLMSGWDTSLYGSYPVADFKYTQTYMGHDAFVNEKEGIRFVFYDDLVESSTSKSFGEVMSMQYAGNGPDGWGVIETFCRDGEADPSLRISKEGMFVKNEFVEPESVTIPLSYNPAEFFFNGLYDTYSRSDDEGEEKIVEANNVPGAEIVDLIGTSYVINNEVDGLMFNVDTQTDSAGNITLVRLHNDYSTIDYAAEYDSAGRITSFAKYIYRAGTQRGDFEFEYEMSHDGSGCITEFVIKKTTTGITTSYTFSYGGNGEVTKMRYAVYDYGDFGISRDYTYTFSYDDSYKVSQIILKGKYYIGSYDYDDYEVYTAQ